MWNIHWWPLRSTLIRKLDDSWELVEHCRRYFALEDPEGEIPECNGVQWRRNPGSYSSPQEQGACQVLWNCDWRDNSNVRWLEESEDFHFASEPIVPYELQPEHEQAAGEVDQQGRR